MSNFANPELDNYFRRIILPSGTAVAPSIVFANDQTQGFYYDVDAGLIKAVGFDGGGGGVTYPLLAPDGTAIAPSYSFTSTPSAGLSIDAGFLTLDATGTSGLQLNHPSLINLFVDLFGVDTIGIALNGTKVDITTTNTRILCDDGSSSIINSISGTPKFTVDVNGVHTPFVSLGDDGFGNSIIAGTGNATFFAGNISTQHIIFEPDTSINFHTNDISNQAMTLDNNSGAGQTKLLLWDISAATLQRVSIGVADSGGVGFRVLRIPN